MRRAFAYAMGLALVSGMGVDRGMFDYRIPNPNFGSNFSGVGNGKCRRKKTNRLRLSHNKKVKNRISSSHK